MTYLEPFIKQVSESIGVHVPTLLLAIAILVVGWLVARIASGIVRKALGRTQFDNRIAAWVSGDKERAAEVDVERWVSRAVFYLIMLFVLVAFFQTIGLTAITEPLNRFLVEIFEYLPRLLGPVILLALAWILATVLRFLVRQVLERANLDQRFADQAAAEEKTIPVSQTLSEAVYWLVFLLFLPAILGPLGLDGLLVPVQNLVDELLGFLPQLLAAGLILAVGWFVARIIQRIVSSLAAAAGVDRAGARLGMDQALGEKKLSGLLGTVVYVLVLIPVLIAALDALAVESITQPASQMLNSVLSAIPQIFAAILVLAIAYLAARFVATLVANLLSAAGFDNLLPRLGLSNAFENSRRTPSQLASHLVLIVIMLFAVTEAARLLGFQVVGELVAQFTVFGGQIILGLVIFGVGLFLANLAAAAVSASVPGDGKMLGMAARVAILVLTGAMALRRMGLANEIINLAFGLTLGAIAVAVALAFGLGARDAAAKQVDKWRGSLQSGKDAK